MKYKNVKLFLQFLHFSIYNASNDQVFVKGVDCSDKFTENWHWTQFYGVFKHHSFGFPIDLNADATLVTVPTERLASSAGVLTEACAIHGPTMNAVSQSRIYFSSCHLDIKI